MNAPLKTTAEAATDFVRRHIGPSPRDVSAMLNSVGASSLTELMSQTLPSSIRQKTPLDLGRAFSETEALAHMRELATQNEVFTSLIGQGYSGTILPAVILAFVAAAGPQYGKGTRSVPATNLDVVVVLDYSKSMYARDVAPSRIAAQPGSSHWLARYSPSSCSTSDSHTSSTRRGRACTKAS